MNGLRTGTRSAYLVGEEEGWVDPDPRTHYDYNEQNDSDYRRQTHPVLFQTQNPYEPWDAWYGSAADWPNHSLFPAEAKEEQEFEDSMNGTDTDTSSDATGANLGASTTAAAKWCLFASCARRFDSCRKL